jgi:hypothetical protein
LATITTLGGLFHHCYGDNRGWDNSRNIEKVVVLPRKTDDDWLITLIVGLLMAIVTVFVSNLSDTSKAVGALALIFGGYVVFNEMSKRRGKSRFKLEVQK